MTKVLNLTFFAILLLFSMNSTKKVHFLKHTVLLDPVFSQLQLSTQAVITTSTVGAYCFLNSNGTIYDLNPIRRGDFDFNRTFANQDRLTVNMCSKANYNCVNRTALATYRTFQNQCIALSGDEKAFTNYTINFDNVTNQTTLNAYLPAGDVCKSNANAKYQMTYNLICDTNASTPIFNANSFDINKCSNEITITTKDACPQFNIYGLWKALMDNKYTFGSTILILGIILAYFGNKFIVFTQIMTGVLITLFVALYFIMSQLSFSLEIWQFWLIIGLCAALGIVAGYFMSQIEWLVPVLLAAFVGFVGGELAYTVAFKYIQSNPVAVYWTIIVVCVVIGALIGYYFSKGIIIVATGIIGAYAVMRGAAFMIGYYPDEKQVYQLTQNKEWDQVDKLLTWHVYVYFIAFLAVAISGIYVQCKYFNKSDEEKQKEENEAKEKLMAEQNAPKQGAQH